jgi:hypothetical protein
MMGQEFPRRTKQRCSSAAAVHDVVVHQSQILPCQPIAKHLVELTGGSVGFESDPAVNPAGTTCGVEPPLKLCDQPKQTVVGEVQSDGMKCNAAVKLIEEPITVLVIADITMIQTMFKRQTKKGIASSAIMAEASSSEKGCVMCKERTFDVIVIDQHAEEAGGAMLGTETVATLRKLLIESIIIRCSSGNEIDNVFMAAGSNWVMVKLTPSNSIVHEHSQQFLMAWRQNRMTLPFLQLCLVVPSDS